MEKNSGSSIFTGRQILRELRADGVLSYESSPKEIYAAVISRSGDETVAEAAVYAALGSSNQTRRTIAAIKRGK